MRTEMSALYYIANVVNSVDREKYSNEAEMLWAQISADGKVVDGVPTNQKQ